MKQIVLQRILRSRFTLAVFAGFVLAASFPRMGLAGLAWIAPGLMLIAALGCDRRQTFRIGYIAGLTHYLTSLYWLLLIPYPAGAIAGWLALSAYLALYPAVWVWLCWRLFPVQFNGHRTPVNSDSETPRARRLIEQFLSPPLWQRCAWSFGCAACWVTMEMIVARLFTGFPWNLLGASQYRIVPVIQIASMTGIYGISFLVVWFSVSLAPAFLSVVLRPGTPRIWLGDLLLPLLAVALVCVFGVRKITTQRESNRSLSVALVQPSIPQTLIWNPKENSHRFSQLIKLSERALEAKPDLLIWPEAAVPNVLRYEPDMIEAITNLVVTHHVWLILGADDAVPRAGSAKREFDFYNSSFLITPSGELQAVYRKRRLVVFGEYIPLVRWLPFLKYVTPIGEGFNAGDRPMPFEMPALKAKTSVLICFEDTFPHVAREHVEPDTDFLLNLTNNGWFGESAAQWQHAASAVFRAIENGLPLVRCANNGLTCWVDPLGQMHEVYFPNSQDIYGAGFKQARVPLLGEGQLRAPTFYRRHGDWFGWLCVGFTGGMLLTLVVRPRLARLRRV